MQVGNVDPFSARTAALACRSPGRCPARRSPPRSLRLMVVAIDGPAGAGKSTVARAAARALGFPYLDSGAMYRAVGLLAHRHGGAASDHAESLDIELGDRVIANGEDVTEAIRAPEVSEAASKVAMNPAVREALVRKQRELLLGWRLGGGGPGYRHRRGPRCRREGLSHGVAGGESAPACQGARHRRADGAPGPDDPRRPGHGARALAAGGRRPERSSSTPAASMWTR